MPMWVVQRHSWTRGPSPVPASPWPLFPPACLSLSEPALGSLRRRGVSRSRAWRSAVCSSVGPPHPVSMQRFLLPEGLLFFPGAETSETFYVYLFEETYNSLTLWFYLLILLCLLDFFFFFFIIIYWEIGFRYWHSWLGQTWLFCVNNCIFHQSRVWSFCILLSTTYVWCDLTRSWLSNSDLISPVRKLSDLPELHR